VQIILMNLLHNKAYGHIEAVRGKPKVDEDGKVIKDEKTGAIEYEGDVYLNSQDIIKV
jgi:hypothetical protein